MAEINEKDFIVLCKEIWKDDGRIAVYEIKDALEKNLLTVLKLRHRFNPELRYFVLKRENEEVVRKALNMKSDRISPLIEDLIVEL